MLPSQIFRRLFFLLALLISSFISTSAQSRTVSVDLNVTATGINRFLEDQTYPILQGESSEEGYFYIITMTKPVVQLTTNSATVLFTINASTDAGTYAFNVQPTISIPNLSITATEVIAVLEEFSALINARSDIPSWLKPIIIDGYNNINLVMYPSKLIDYANSAVPDFINVEVTDIGLAFAIVPGALKFTLSVVAVGTPPTFTAQWMKRGVGQLSIRFGSDVHTTVKQVRIYNFNGDELYNNNNENKDLPNDSYCTQIDPSNYFGVTYYSITVLFHSPYGDYVRKYTFKFDTATYNTWFTTTYASGIN